MIRKFFRPWELPENTKNEILHVMPSAYARRTIDGWIWLIKKYNYGILPTTISEELFIFIMSNDGNNR